MAVDPKTQFIWEVERRQETEAIIRSMPHLRKLTTPVKQEESKPEVEKPTPSSSSATPDPVEKEEEKETTPSTTQPEEQGGDAGEAHDTDELKAVGTPVATVALSTPIAAAPVAAAVAETTVTEPTAKKKRTRKTST